jgi:CheY-like chemotaxis protein/two-component sensor histidine kinase
MAQPADARQALLQDNGRPRIVPIEDLHAIFIRTVAHELRTPLSILQGYAELLDSEELGGLTPQQKYATDIIVDRTLELRSLVERIGVLLAARAHATVSLPLSLTAVISSVVEDRRAAAIEAELELDVFLEPSLPLVTGDPYQLQLALDCLLENAIKFTPSGGRVDIRTYSEPGWVCLDISDTGVGMTTEQVEHAFNLFYQMDGSTTRHYRGLGLGLGLVRAVVEGHGGQVAVASQPDQGSRFSVKLPALPEGVAEELALRGGTGPRRILVVDDEENVALIIQDGLEKLPNCEVTVVTSGEEALRLFEQRSFDLLITDYKMPGTDGIRLAASVQQLYPGTKIIMITAYSSQLLRQQATRASIRFVLDKPVKLDEIRSIALETLETSGVDEA